MHRVGNIVPRAHCTRAPLHHAHFDDSHRQGCGIGMSVFIKDHNRIRDAAGVMYRSMICMHRHNSAMISSKRSAESARIRINRQGRLSYVARVSVYAGVCVCVCYTRTACTHGACTCVCTYIHAVSCIYILYPAAVQVCMHT